MLVCQRAKHSSLLMEEDFSEIGLIYFRLSTNIPGLNGQQFKFLCLKICQLKVLEDKTFLKTSQMLSFVQNFRFNVLYPTYGANMASGL